MKSASNQQSGAASALWGASGALSNLWAFSHSLGQPLTHRAFHNAFFLQLEGTLSKNHVVCVDTCDGHCKVGPTAEVTLSCLWFWFLAPRWR